MQLYDLKDFKGGWFVGDFVPTLFPITTAEVCIKRYKAGDHDQKHIHKEADEITVVVEGIVEMNGVKYHADDVVLIDRGEATDFTAITDAVTCVVKVPCVIGDKHLV